MTITLTARKVLGMDPPFIVCRNISELPGGDTPYTASEMAERGVPHRTIIWAFLRPSVLGAAFGETVCRIAEAVLPAFEAARPGDTGPGAAIEAARRCFADPTADNRLAANAASGQAGIGSRAARASWQGPAVAWTAAEAAAAAAQAVAWTAADVAQAATWATLAGDAAFAANAARTAAQAVRAGCSEAKLITIIEEEGL
ncbi:MAG: hypothetical protein GY767_17795 [Shimia sp.]|nr:hypothetical protein [Shimia sp.]